MKEATFNGLGWANRASVGAAVDRVGFSKVALSVRRAVPSWITVLTYHRVSRRDDPTVLDDTVVDVDPDQFVRHLQFVKRWFNPIGIDQLSAFARGRGRLPRNPLMVTFDDGYRDNHDVALPLLVKHGVRAVFFLATDYVERRRLYWWDRVSLIVGRCKRPRLVFAYPEPMSFSLENPEARRASVRRLKRVIEARPGLDLGRFLEELEHAADVTLPAAEERRLADATVMTWAHARALRRAGMDVQSHTHTHRALQTLEGSDLERELRVSKTALEDALDEPVLGLSYPVGRPVKDAPRIRRAVLDAGYQLGFSNATGVNRVRGLDALDVKRVALDLSMGDRLFRTMLAVPWFAS
jgi:peptidoglycan/xylan/chitin deacetylase (PgdA/CDA1 family)